MAGTKEIQTRMHSIQDTMKITRAMYMISSAKLKKARKTLENSAVHFQSIQESITSVLCHVPDMDNTYFGYHKPKNRGKKVGYLVVTADKGLAGAYNHNVIRMVEQQIATEQNVELFVVGQMGRSYFEKKGYRIHHHFKYTAQNPSVHRARVISEDMLVRYNEQRLDEIYMVYTRNRNGFEREPEVVKLLPLSKESFNQSILAGCDTAGETRYLPSPEDVMNLMVPNYITGYIYGALVEAYACEHNDRMVAMDAATQNATEMLRTLTVEYNRMRQAAITQEITEVIAGAKAQRRKKEGNEEW